MGKITYRAKSKKRRLNSIQSESDQQEVGISDLTPSTPSSLRLDSSASDGSHTFSPGFCHNNIGQLTFNTSTVITCDKRKRNPEPQTQDEFSDPGASTTVLRTPKKMKKLRRSRSSAIRRSLNPPSGTCAIEGEIAGALVTSEYHCSQCGFRIPSWPPLRFNVKCSGCKTSWKCCKVPCTCKAKITLELPDGLTQRVTLEDSLLRSIVNFKQRGYCKTDIIEKKVLKVGSVRVVCNDGVVKNVVKSSSSSMSLRDVFPTDSGLQD